MNLEKEIRRKIRLARKNLENPGIKISADLMEELLNQKARAEKNAKKYKNKYLKLKKQVLWNYEQMNSMTDYNAM